ncbi:MAG: hypothetical protein KDC44_22645, partial [Phaeodactylibacter sp.]|nr:hypothetical protein [Phaeodactylibacter sp.]
MGKHHGMRRGMYELFLQSNTRSAAGSTASGRFGEFFGFLFDRESTTTYTEAQLIALAEKMTERVGDPPADLNTPIGFAFLGQFIDHDTTLDVVTALGEAAGDITKIRNVRTPRLELDSVYLSGPDGSEYLYEEDKLHLTLGTRNNPLDLQRNRNNIAIIGDSRNDENLFINQLHGLFIRFHNWVVDQGKTFEEARQFVRWTYQKIVVEEFLAEVIADSTYNPIRTEFETNKRLPRPVNWNRTVALPIEFSAAAYRFGHSHVRQDYQINDSLTGNLFRFGGFQPVRPEQNIDWKYFFDIDGSSFLKARPI